MVGLATRQDDTSEGTVVSSHPWARARRGRHTWGMQSTMQNAPLLIRDLLFHGQRVHGDSSVITVEEGGSRRSTFTEVAARAEKLAAALTRLGIEQGDRVGTFCWNNQGHLEAYLAIPCMGAVLHTLNIRLPAEQLAYVINHAEDRCIIVDASHIPLLAGIKDDLKTVETIIVGAQGDTAPLGETLSYERLLAAEQPGIAWPDLDERSAAAMCYTSGTTGLPKGVVYSHRSTYLHSMAACTANGLGISERDRVLPVVPQFHANAWGLAYAALIAGADLVMPDRFMTPAAIVKLIETERVTVGAGEPTILQGVLAHLQTVGAALSSLRTVVCGGSALPEAVMRAYADEFGITMTHAWGMTELSPIGSVAREPAGVTGEAVWPYRASQGRVGCRVGGRAS